MQARNPGRVRPEACRETTTGLPTLRVCDVHARVVPGLSGGRVMSEPIGGRHVFRWLIERATASHMDRLMSVELPTRQQLIDRIEELLADVEATRNTAPSSDGYAKLISNLGELRALGQIYGE